MQAQGYRVTLAHQEGHWWYRSRRELWLRQVDRAARVLGYPARRLDLLDYGCAAGFDLPSLARFGAAHGADVVDAGQIAALTGGVEPPPGEAFPIHRVPADLPALRGRFHIITCLDVLEHMDDDVAGLRSIAALLAPGGQLVVTAPAYDWLWSGEDVISEHRRRYTRATLLRAARAAGFDVLFASYFFATVLPAVAAVVWSRRLMSNRWRAQTNLDAHPRWLGGVLRAVTSAEARLVGDERLSLPAGTSLVCRLRLPERS
jgi:2-polyprenyl-3-methyl-5-hydroxy-6-metoxy-1,4-benzoquinol methylase